MDIEEWLDSESQSSLFFTCNSTFAHTLPILRNRNVDEGLRIQPYIVLTRRVLR